MHLKIQSLLQLQLTAFFPLTSTKSSNVSSCILLFKLIFGVQYIYSKYIRVQLLYNVVLVPTVQQSESAIRIHISPVFWISFPFRSPTEPEQSSLSYTVGSRQFLHIINSVYMSKPISQFIPLQCILDSMKIAFGE